MRGIKAEANGSVKPNKEVTEVLFCIPAINHNKSLLIVFNKFALNKFSMIYLHGRSFLTF